MSLAVGVDACEGGWVAVALDDEGVRSARFVAQIASLFLVVPEAVVIGIDIPIGLPHSGGREADLEARKLLGPRRSSVFMTPSRSALGAVSHAEATAIACRDTGKGLSKQAFALATKVFEVDAWIPRAPCPVYEVHPEVSFAMLLGAPAQSSKRTWAGMVERRRALAGAGLLLEDAPGDAGLHASVDDMLNAAVAAWSARRILQGCAVSLPDTPETGQDGRSIAIWA